MKSRGILFWIAIVVAVLAAAYHITVGVTFVRVAVLMREVAEGHSSSETQSAVLDPAAAGLRVVARKYEWWFHYAGADGVRGKTHHSQFSDDNPVGLDPADPAGADDIHGQELVLPCEESIHVTMDSWDVIHSLGNLHEDFQMDAIPGVREVKIFRSPAAPKAGRLRCVQLCGPGCKDHYAPFRFVAKAEFEAWMRGRQSAVESRPQH